MGTDGTVVIERKEGNFWETIGTMTLPRNYDLFMELHQGFVGYPYDICYLSKDILNAVEDWGEAWMTYEDFRKLLKQYDLEYYDTIKKKYRDKCRVIYRFDN